MTPSLLGELVLIERAALTRLWARSWMIVLSLLGAEVGALAFATALVRLRSTLAGGALDALAVSLGATGLGLDLFIVLASLTFGAAVAALARPLEGAALILPSARTSAGAVSIGGACFIVIYALSLGIAQLVPQMLARVAEPYTAALILALTLAPPLFVVLLLLAAATAAIALVGRGVTPGRALGSGLDHVLRAPVRALLLLAGHAALSVALLGLGALFAVEGLHRLVAVAPLWALGGLLAIAAFDAAIARDPRIATG